ncbi:MAG: alanine--glyoxylate aminotransferase family protein, partial [Chloroflexi bacterium]|nr:alanine--glyoxylate aminotransferase family protein [Chloroflexota bacterium]
PRYASNTVTAVRNPEGIDGSKLRKIVREQHGVVLAGGQGQISGDIFRIGHLGYVSEADVDEALTAIAAGLSSLRVEVSA